jgi:dTDP-4-dehydrorhamnose reductase
MKILLLEKNGQLRWELQRSLAPLGEVAVSRLATKKITSIFGLELPFWQLHAKRIVAEIVYNNEPIDKRYQ